MASTPPPPGGRPWGSESLWGDPRFDLGRDLSSDRFGRRIEVLDRRPLRAVEILTHLRGSRTTSVNLPHLFADIDGAEWWVKAKAQGGLLSELVGGRLADRLGVGPLATIVHVSPQALPNDDSLARFMGLRVGSRHVADSFDGKELSLLVGSGRLNPTVIDARSRARVIAFHTWVNAVDEQVLVCATDGTVLSFDHGACFQTLEPGPPSRIVVAPIPGVSADIGRDWGLVSAAVDAIEALNIDDILDAVSGVPQGPEWRALLDRRVAIAEWLVNRKAGLREEMAKWAPPLS